MTKAKKECTDRSLHAEAVRNLCRNAGGDYLTQRKYLNLTAAPPASHNTRENRKNAIRLAYVAVLMACYLFLPLWLWR
jgi:hypothetical protein